MSKSSKHIDGTRYEVTLQEDENGDLLLPIPPLLLEQLGWYEGDEIDFKVDNQGRYILAKVDK